MAAGAENERMNATPDISIRPAHAHDFTALWQVAGLDDTSVPEGPMLVAEVDGEIVAALSLASGEKIADPFRRTAETVALLRLRASQVRRERVVRQRGLLRRLVAA